MSNLKVAVQMDSPEMLDKQADSTLALIEEALKKAVQKVDSTEIVEGEGAEPSQELSARVKRLMARKTNLQRRRRNKLPSKLR